MVHVRHATVCGVSGIFNSTQCNHAMCTHAVFHAQWDGRLHVVFCAFASALSTAFT